jgi:C4-dicarboxylate transporter DctM subunit
VNLFVGARVGGSTLEAVSRGSMPFLLAMFIILLLVTYVPSLSLFLPELMGL